MRVVLVNSTVMPHEGKYICRGINKEDFCKLLSWANEKGILENYIGYPQNLEIIKEWTGVELTPSREQTYLKHGEEMLVMKLKYRVKDPSTKGKEVDENDFEFFFVQYFEV